MKKGITLIVIGALLLVVAAVNVIFVIFDRGAGWTAIILPTLGGFYALIYGLSKVGDVKKGVKNQAIEEK